MTDATNNELLVKHHETARRGEFRIGEIGEMTYTRPRANVMRVHHTEVEKEHRGKGLAQQMYRAMATFARQHQRKVIAVCPFVVAMFEQNPQDADVLVS